jgi:hypothetical protein
MGSDEGGGMGSRALGGLVSFEQGGSRIGGIRVSRGVGGVLLLAVSEYDLRVRGSSRSSRSSSRGRPEELGLFIGERSSAAVRGHGSSPSSWELRLCALRLCVVLCSADMASFKWRHEI